MELSGYKISETLHEGRNIIVYRGAAKGSGSSSLPVIIKTLSGQYPNVKNIGKLKHEFEID
jgi:hypothetical protein